MDFKVETNFDPDDWERQVKKQIARNAEREYQRTFDQLSRTYQGQPKDEIRQALRRELDLDGDPDEEWVDAIHDGTQIEVNFEWQ